MKTIIELNNLEAKHFFQESHNYCNLDLPIYFNFSPLLCKVSEYLDNKQFNSLINSTTKPYELSDVNYIFLNNKDGKFSWRPFQLIHPAFYIYISNLICNETNWHLLQNRFKEFKKNQNIKCYSLPPAEDFSTNSISKQNIQSWWKNIEQQSIELALIYDYVLHTDINNCYGSIYTHSIAWAIHGKDEAKNSKNDKTLLGNLIDKAIRDMCHGQTNGIPQGSTLMDFIAEIILGYIDLSLTIEIEKTEINNYKIIRYRDDYRIFTHSPHEAEHIAKLLTECLLNMGMSLNNQKTGISNNIIQSSIKPDKLFWINHKRSNKSLQEHLILIHQLSIKFPNSGALKKSLDKFHSRFEIESKEIEVIDYKVLISLVVDIMVKNPVTYRTTTAILSELFTFCTLPNECEEILSLILRKFKNIPNTGHLEVWLQRLTIKYERFFEYLEPITKKVNDQSVILWNSSWLTPALSTIIDSFSIVDENSIENISHIITSEEITIFKTFYDNNY